MGAHFFDVGASGFFMPSYMPRTFPVSAACWMLLLSSTQYSLAQRLAVCCARLLAVRKARLFLVGACLYRNRADRFASKMGIICVVFASNQPRDLLFCFPEVSTAARWMPVPQDVPCFCSRGRGGRCFVHMTANYELRK